jgi:lysophospholipase L1-like esterase
LADEINHIIEKSSPYDLAIIMLGTNDLKNKYKQNPQTITNALKENINQLSKANPELGQQSVADIVIVAPPTIQSESAFDNEFLHGIEKSKTLKAEYQSLAKDLGCYYIDPESITKAKLCSDGIHLTAAGHQTFGEIIADYVNCTVLSINHYVC